MLYGLGELRLRPLSLAVAGSLGWAWKEKKNHGDKRPESNCISIDSKVLC